MAYDLHVTRATDLSRRLRERPQITWEEWITYVRAEGADWQVQDVHLIKSPRTGETCTIKAAKGTSITSWMRHPRVPEGAAFRWSHGEIIVPSRAFESLDADDPGFAKLMQIAAHFEARIVGDEGELIFDPGAAEADPRRSRSTKAAKKRR